MSLFQSLFGGNTGGISHGPGGAAAVVQTTAPATTVATGAAQPDNSSQTIDATKGVNSPLDNLQSFWDTPTDAQGKPVAAPVDPLASPIFTLNSAKVKESAAKLDFTAGIDQTALTEAFGDKAGLLMQMMNQVGQQAFVAGTLNTGSMIDHGVKSNNNRFQSTLPRHIKEVQLSQTGTSNPVLSHPAAIPLVNGLKKMAFDKNPDANPADVMASVEALLLGLGTAMADTTPEATQRKEAVKAGEQDWSSFLN